MRIDHRRRNVGVTEQLLDRTNILPRFEQMGCEAVPKGMTSHFLQDSGALDCGLYRCLHCILVDVVAAKLFAVTFDNMGIRWTFE